MTEDFAPGAIGLTLDKKGFLRKFDRMKPLREPVGGELTGEKARKLFADLLFPPLTPERVREIVLGRSGSLDWQARLSAATRLASPEALAGIITRSYAQGKTQQQIAKELLPAVQGVQSTARRIARTEGMRIAHETQMDMFDQLGDLVVGYQVHAQLDQNTRPWHAARNGTIYYNEPKPGQKGPAQMPNPPMEAEDPRERPAGAPRTAWNCRCFLSPVLRPPEYARTHPEKLNVFRNSAGKAIPNPDTYSAWFDQADERRRRLAVGTRRYSAIRDALDTEPTWAHFIDPRDGDLMPLSALRAESPTDRAERVQIVLKQMAQRAGDIRQVSTFGFTNL